MTPPVTSVGEALHGAAAGPGAVAPGGGLWSLPSSAGFILASMATPLLVRRAAPGAVMAACLGGTGERYRPEVAALLLGA